MNQFLRISTVSALALLAITQANAANHKHHDTKPAFKQGYYVGGAFGAGWGNADWDGTSLASHWITSIPTMTTSPHVQAV
ncbi:MAG: hypothetical protein ACHQAX_05010 [Gammaproteobacteria bacterium]